MGTTLHIAERWRALLQEHRFCAYEDFFRDRADLTRLATERSASVSRLIIHDPGKPQVFYLKRCFSERPRVVIRNLLKGRLYRQLAVVEKNNLQYLQALGYDVMQIAAWGERRCCGYPISSFLLVEQVKGVEFQEFYQQADGRVRSALFRRYGELVGGMHRADIDSIIRPQDLFCVGGADGISFQIIDREEGSTRARNRELAEITHELATMFVKGIIRYNAVAITVKEALYFCQGYLAANPKIKLSARQLFALAGKDVETYMNTRHYCARVRDKLHNSVFQYTYREMS